MTVNKTQTSVGSPIFRPRPIDSTRIIIDSRTNEQVASITTFDAGNYLAERAHRGLVVSRIPGIPTPVCNAACAQLIPTYMSCRARNAERKTDREGEREIRLDPPRFSSLMRRLISISPSNLSPLCWNFSSRRRFRDERSPSTFKAREKPYS